MMTLEHIAIVQESFQELGRRHVAYGVEEPHYDTVGTALMLTLEQGLGTVFTGQVKEAWVATYESLSTVMKRAAYPNSQAASGGVATT